MGSELIARIAARSHGQNFGLDSVCAFNIQRGVTDYEDLLSVQFFPKNSAAPFSSNHSDPVPIFMIVPKCACLKKIPQSIMAQFDLRAQPDIPGEQS
jgi:hypothetical protein